MGARGGLLAPGSGQCTRPARSDCRANRKGGTDAGRSSKKFAVDVAVWALDQCQRAMGATGASADHRLAMLSSETRLAAFGDGTSQMLLDRIAKGLAKDYGPSPAQKESDR